MLLLARRVGYLVEVCGLSCGVWLLLRAKQGGGSGAEQDRRLQGPAGRVDPVLWGCQVS